MIVKTSGKMRNHIKARERNGLMEGSLENSEMREFEGGQKQAGSILLSSEKQK